MEWPGHLPLLGDGGVSSQLYHSVQNLGEIKRSRIPHHLSQHWRDLHRQGTAGSGSQCEPTTILNV